jgi:hypothetical protein
MIMRPVGEQWQIISSAYIQGMMNGELWPDDEQQLETFTII